MRKVSIFSVPGSRSRRDAIQIASFVAVVMFAGMTACAPSALVDVQSPSTVVDPAVIKTASGAIKLRLAALGLVVDAYAGGDGSGNPLGGLIGYSGLLTDELMCGDNGGFACFPDRRILSASKEPTYGAIQQARVAVRLAREALLAYSTPSATAPAAWQGELYALEGYTVLWFAENYCSGIPLTSVPLNGKQTPTRGFTTQELYARAIALFDSAAVLGADSATYVNFAKVGKGRALLGLGQFTAADSAVATVPTDFVYQISSSYGALFYFAIEASRNNSGQLRVQDHEGGNGLVWSTDPRTGVMAAPSDPSGWLRAVKYNVDESGSIDPTHYNNNSPTRLADGLEARLIQAEAAVARGDATWLTILNDLRNSCVGAAPCAPVPGLTVASLPALTDPGDDTSRVNLIMQERAMWLYLTAHREADFRRLARVYHRDQGTLWPTGIYHSPSFPDLDIRNPTIDGTQYGSAVVLGPDASEQANNSLYGGCYDLNP